MNKKFSIFLSFFQLFILTTLSQVGIMLFENNITLLDFETYSKLRIYGSNRSIVELSYREVGINEILHSTGLRNIIQNLSEQKNSVRIEFFQDIIDFKVSEEKIASEDILFVIKRDKNTEPGYRIFFISAKELKEAEIGRDYSVSIVPLVEMPLIVFIDGVAIRRLDILDIEITYENMPVINVIIKNSGTVTTSFKLSLNISNKTLYAFDTIKPKETKIIKFPVNFFGKFNASALVDYYSNFSFFEKEIEIKEFLPITEKIEVILTNILPYLIICISLIISLFIIIKKKKD